MRMGTDTHIYSTSDNMEQVYLGKALMWPRWGTKRGSLSLKRLLYAAFIGFYEVWRFKRIAGVYSRRVRYVVSVILLLWIVGLQ